MWFSCKYNICSQCIDKHKNHKIVKFEEISPNIGDIKKRFFDSLEMIQMDGHVLSHVVDRYLDDLEFKFNIHSEEYYLFTYLLFY